AAKLTYDGTIPKKKSLLKSGKSNFDFEIGDNLKFTGYVNDDFETIVDAPTTNNDYLFDINNADCPFTICGEETEIVDVTNPSTGETWMDRNLGACQQATASDDYNAYVAIFQWGRLSDGHECITWTGSSSGTPVNDTTSTLSNSDDPGHNDFILSNVSPYDWRDPQNDDLWDGASSTNNPCPSGYRLPTEAELNTERTSWGSNNSAGAYGSPLKFPVAGYRYNSDGSLSGAGSNGYYWSSTADITSARRLYFYSNYSSPGSGSRASGYSVRCIKD
ncbi:MAG: FISUMP domain-containing protein, partial [Bacteroidota bacterium]|nr:FISUMP domain-containing protein [Bacteroidota bacterium]